MTETANTVFTKKRVMIPIGVPDLDQTFKGTEFNPDVVRAVIGLISLQWRRKRKRLKEIHGANVKRTTIPEIEIRSAILQILGGKHYTRYMNKLYELGWVTVRTKPGNTKPSYWGGVSAAKYKFTEAVLMKPGELRKFRLEFVTDIKVLGQIDKVRIATNKFIDEKRAEKIVDDVTQLIWTNSDKIRVDLSAIESMKIKKGTKPGISMEQRNELLCIGEAINEGTIRYYKVDSFGRRVHHLLTNTNKLIRPALYFDGYADTPTSICDFKNSQAYLCSLLLMKPQLCLEMVPEFAPLENVIRGIEKSPDIITFNYVCSTGELYKQWALANGIIQRKVKKMSDEKKAIAKKLFMRFINAAPGPDGWGVNKRKLKFKTDMAFRSCYSSTYHAICAIKSVPQNLLPFMQQHYDKRRAKDKARGKEERGSYAYLNLPAILQRLESEILRRISRRLVEAGITLFLTVHDSWLLLERDAEKATQIIKTYFKELGVQPPEIAQEPQYRGNNSVDNDVHS
jgi:hypothetical protein